MRVKERLDIHRQVIKMKRKMPEEVSFAARLEEIKKQKAQVQKEREKEMVALRAASEKHKVEFRAKRLLERKAKSEEFENLKKLCIIAEEGDTKPDFTRTTTKKPQPATLQARLPLPLQANIGGEIDSLQVALSALHQNLDVKGGQDLVSLQSARRALLGITARIMELIMQPECNIAALMPAEAAEKFRNVVFHGNVIPEVREDKLQEAVAYNARIYDMAFRLNDLLVAKQTAVNAELVAKIKSETLFGQIMASEIKELSERDKIEERYKREKFIVSCIEGYQAANGHYAKYQAVMAHAIGYTKGIIGTLASKKLAMGYVNHNESREILRQEVQEGIQYRHVKGLDVPRSKKQERSK